jgi:DNA-binding NtrC family response regulator
MGKPWDTVIAISDSEDRRTLAKILGQFGIDAMCVGTVAQCRELLEKGDVGLVFASEFFADGDFRSILAVSLARKLGPTVILAASRNAKRTDDAMQLGIFDAIGIPFRPTDVEWTVIKARRTREALAESQAAASSIAAAPALPPGAFHGLVRQAS